MGSSAFVAALWVSLVSSGALGAGFDGIPGDYCRTRTPITCCPSRDDECTVPILDTLCYCDMFCDRSDGGDCCPDFKAFCRGVPPIPVSTGGCKYQGQTYGVGQSTKQNCNDCQCVSDTSSPDGSRWSCSSNPCLIEDDYLEAVRSGRHSWQASNYSQFWGQSLDDGIKFRLGTLYPERSVQNMNEILVKVNPDIPDRFDAREKWPNFIHPVRNQGNCGSSWAFSTTSLSADRLAIQSDGRINSVLSPQQLLSCNQHRQQGCEGGYLDRAWWYIRKLGVVSDECYPYKSGETDLPGECKIDKSQYRNVEGIRCPSGDSNNKVFKMTPPYRLSQKEQEIQTEIMTNGPIQATFLVHEDFYMYKSGVYQHLKLAERKDPKYAKSGYHSVRILGWGVDQSSGLKYWLADNSWGPEWGENGYFRIIRGDNHCNVESFLIGAWGKGSKKRKKFLVRKVKKIRRL